MEQVTYIVDTDLIRFGKFALAILGIFVVVGISLFGVNLKEMYKQFSEAREQLKDILHEVQDTQREVSEAQRRIDKAQARMDEGLAQLQERSNQTEALQAETERLKRRADAAVRSITQREQRSRELLIAMQNQEGRSIVQTIQSEEEVRPGIDRGKLWANGVKLKVAFLGVNAAIQQRVRDAAAEWSEHANISFDFEISAEDAEIRIGAERGDGTWSYVGRDALNIPTPDRTMNIDPTWPEDVQRTSILIHLGHAVGLLKEHQNPRAEIPWDKEAVYRAFEGPPNFWDRLKVDHILFNPWPNGSFPLEKPYDAGSIMHYEIRNEWTVGDFEVTPPRELSDGDKAWIARLYPKK